MERVLAAGGNTTGVTEITLGVKRDGDVCTADRLHLLLRPVLSSATGVSPGETGSGDVGAGGGGCGVLMAKLPEASMLCIPAPCWSPPLCTCHDVALPLSLPGLRSISGTFSGLIGMDQGSGEGGCGRSLSAWVSLRPQAERNGCRKAGKTRSWRIPRSGVGAYPKGCRQITGGPVWQLLQETIFGRNWGQVPTHSSFLHCMPCKADGTCGHAKQ